MPPPTAKPGPALRPPLPGEAIELHDARAGRLQLYAAAPPGAARRATTPLLLVHSVNAAASAYEIRPLYERFASERPTYGVDLPGFGRSERSPRRYTPRLMTDAILAAVAHVRRRHAGAPIDALAVSLSTEFLARAALAEPAAFRSLALVSPTGLAAGKRRDGPPGSTLGMEWLHTLLTVSLWRRTLFGLLTRPGVVRYFLKRTFGSSHIDEGLWAYAVETARPVGAEHAPLCFLSGHLFSGDATLLYERLALPVWISHGVRGDFVDYGGVDALLERQAGWTRDVFETGALPYFEVPEPFAAAYTDFMERLSPHPHINSA